MDYSKDGSTYDTKTAPQLPPHTVEELYTAIVKSLMQGAVQRMKSNTFSVLFVHGHFIMIPSHTIKVLITVPKNNPRRSLVLKLERKKYVSMRIAPYIDCTLAL